ncbi:MAG: hypothetical protein ACUVS3_04525 [Thermodesulfobacteriota bacterium]
MEFEERTIKVIVEEEKCQWCRTHACVEACKKFDRSILQLVDGKPGVTLSAEELKRLGTECLACEFACRQRGNGAIRIEVPIAGLDEYRRKHGTA